MCQEGVGVQKCSEGRGVYKGERICKMKVLRLKLILSVRTLCTQLFCYFPGRKTLPTNVVSACISLSLSLTLSPSSNLCLCLNLSRSLSECVCVSVLAVSGVVNSRRGIIFALLCA